MLAFGLTIVLFAFWGVLGYSLIRAIKPRLDPLQEMLLAPTVGFVVVTVPLFIFSRFGLPVSRFAYPLTIVLLVAAGTPLLVSRPRLPWRSWRAFGAVLALALVATAWPMLQFGFDWLSLCNDDMANYCLGAARFYDYGFFHTPAARDLIDGRDYAHYYWFLHVKMMVRPGIELLLAWMMGVTRLTAHQVFMPTIMALHLCQVSALGALMHPSPKTRKPALAGCALLAVSALATAGALYQLIAQVGGMALLAATGAVLLRPIVEPREEASEGGGGAGGPESTGEAVARPPQAPRGSPLRRGILAGVMGAGLFLLYPEVIPIVGAAWLGFMVLETLRGRVQVKALAVFLGAALFAVVVLLGRQAWGIAGFLFQQSTAGSTDMEAHESLFPYYQVPSGLADFWGFFPITLVPPEPIASTGIAVGGLMLIATLLAAGWLAWRGHGVALVCLVMMALAAYLVHKNAQFGLYKMAMFLQAFALGTVALAAFAVVKWPRARVALLVVLALPGLFVQQLYVTGSRGTGSAGSFPEIADPSRSRVNDAFMQVVNSHRAAALGGGVVCDTPNVVLAKFQSYHARSIPTAYPGAPVGVGALQYMAPSFAPQETQEMALRLRDAVVAHWPKLKFRLHEPGGADGVNRFTYAALGPLLDLDAVDKGTSPAPQRVDNKETLLVASGPKQSVVNRWGPLRRMGRAAHEMSFTLHPLDHVRDHLVFVESELGRSYYSSAKQISLFQLEPDPVFLRHATMAGAGRRFLFEVVNPTPGLRLVMEMTTSFAADGQNLLPEGAAAVGAGRQAFGITGRGSARVFSPPLEPQQIEGRTFVGIDMGREPKSFREPRTGLMRLYGRDVLLDRRRLVGFARDISAISQRQYAGLRAPSKLETFPADLQNQDLEYSGIYEDGWASDHAWAALSAPWDAREVVVKGFVPEFKDAAFETEMTVRVDGREVARRVLGLKGFEVRVPLPEGTAPIASASADDAVGAAAEAAAPKGSPGRTGKATPDARRRIDLQFSRLQNLPSRDMRPVACLISYLGFESAPRPPAVVSRFPDDVNSNPLLSPAGLYTDGWAAPRTSVRLSQPPGHDLLAIRGMVPKVADAGFQTTLRVRVDGRVAAEQVLAVGDFDLNVPAEGARPGPRNVELEFTAGQTLPGDGRAVGARLSSLGFVTPPLPPARVASFPQDFRNPLLDAKGLFEDGWAAEVASLRLGQPADANTLVVAGSVPKIGEGEAADGQGFTTDLRVMVDGEEVGRKTLVPGEFRMELPAVEPTLAQGVARRVELRFSNVQTLPGGDGRAVGAKVSEVGFVATGR